jgi:hypothetical protein
MTSWPDGFEDDLGAAASMLYVTPAEARELHAEMVKTFERLVGKDHRFAERRDPERRPADAVPVEFVLLGYPVLDSPPLPGDDETGDDPDADPGVEHRSRAAGNVRPPRHNGGAG